MVLDQEMEAVIHDYAQLLELTIGLPDAAPAKAPASLRPYSTPLRPPAQLRGSPEWRLAVLALLFVVYAHAGTLGNHRAKPAFRGPATLFDAPASGNSAKSPERQGGGAGGPRSLG